MSQRWLKRVKSDGSKGVFKSMKNFLGLYDQGESIVEVFDV